MRWERIKERSNEAFRRLTGVQKPSFEKMIVVLKEAQRQKTLQGGRPSKFCLEDRLLMSLEYLREYRTYFHIGKHDGLVHWKCDKEWGNPTKKLPHLASARQGWLEVSVKCPYNGQDPFGVRTEHGPSSRFWFKLEELSGSKAKPFEPTSQERVLLQCLHLRSLSESIFQKKN